LVPGSRGGFGLYQLTGMRLDAYESFAASRGVDPSDVDTHSILWSASRVWATGRRARLCTARKPRRRRALWPRLSQQAPRQEVRSSCPAGATGRRRKGALVPPDEDKVA